jgi:hypothetical protein
MEEDEIRGTAVPGQPRQKKSLWDPWVNGKGWTLWCISIISATAWSIGTTIAARPVWAKSETLPPKWPEQNKAGSVAQGAEILPYKCKSMSVNPSTATHTHTHTHSHTHTTHTCTHTYTTHTRTHKHIQTCTHSHTHTTHTHTPLTHTHTHTHTHIV